MAAEFVAQCGDHLCAEAVRLPRAEARSRSTSPATVRAPLAPSVVSCSTGVGLRFVTTTWCPQRSRRRAMLALIRPSPTIPHCIVIASFYAGGRGESTLQATASLPPYQ